jgi:SAM-dependent methyltransferase
MILRSIDHLPFLKRAHHNWVNKKIQRFESFLQKSGKIIDLGCGNGYVCAQLKSKGFAVTPVDVRNLSKVKEINPVIYDGLNLPFEDYAFESCLLLTVLHHCEQPLKVIKEACRVSHELIIIEDVYSNWMQKILTQSIDLIVNLGHSKMTFQNKKETEWEQLFKEQGLVVKHKSNKRVLLFVRQTTYHLTSIDKTASKLPSKNQVVNQLDYSDAKG